MKVNSYILLEFKGRVNGPLLDQLLASLQWNLEETEASLALRKRVFSVALECFQNVYRYSPLLTHYSDAGEVSEDMAYAEAQLFVKFEKGHYIIGSGNMILNEQRSSLKDALDEVNSATPDSLMARYKKALQNYATSNQRGAGLGLMDMKRKSNSQLHYTITDRLDHSWFELEIQLS